MHAQQRHGKASRFVGRQRQFGTSVGNNLVAELQEFGIQLFSMGCELCPLCVVEHGGRRELDQRNAMQQRRQFLQGRVEAEAAGLHRRAHGQHGLDVAGGQCIEQGIEMLVAHRAQHRPHAFFLDPAGAVRDGLVEQRQRVAHRAGRRLGDLAQRTGVASDAFGFQHAREVLDDMARRHLLEVELQAA